MFYNLDEKFNLRSDHHKLIRETWDSHQQSKDDEMPSELSLYLRTPPTGHLDDKPLSIWEELKETYPTLYKVMPQYMSTVATSVPSERLFSKGLVLNQQRNRLKGKLLSQILFLQSIDKNL